MRENYYRWIKLVWLLIISIIIIIFFLQIIQILEDIKVILDDAIIIIGGVQS